MYSTYIHDMKSHTCMYIHVSTVRSYILYMKLHIHTLYVMNVCAQYECVCVHLYVVCDNSYRPNSNGMICIVLLSSCLWWR